MQQQSAATAPRQPDDSQPAQAFRLRHRPPVTALPPDGKEKVQGLAAANARSAACDNFLSYARLLPVGYVSGNTYARANHVLM